MTTITQEVGVPEVATARAIYEPAGWWGLVRGALRTRGGRIGAALMGLVILIAAIGPFVAPNSSSEFVTTPFAAPTAAAPLGGDTLGRDVLSRLLDGGWQLLVMAALATLLGVALGAAVGVVSAFRGGAWDALLMRTSDVLLAFPQIVLALLLLSVVGPKAWLIVVAVALGHAPQVGRVIRSAALDVCERDFVRSSELIALPRWQTMFGEILPNLTSPLMVEAGLRLTYSISIIASLSFLGFGLPPPSPNWGAMINENRIALSTNPWATLAPVALIAVLTIGTNTFTDAIARVGLGADHRRVRARWRRRGRPAATGSAGDIAS